MAAALGGFLLAGGFRPSMNAIDVPEKLTIEHRIWIYGTVDVKGLEPLRALGDLKLSPLLPSRIEIVLPDEYRVDGRARVIHEGTVAVKGDK